MKETTRTMIERWNDDHWNPCVYIYVSLEEKEVCILRVNVRRFRASDTFIVFTNINYNLLIKRKKFDNIRSQKYLYTIL